MSAPQTYRFEDTNVARLAAQARWAKWNARAQARTTGTSPRAKRSVERARAADARRRAREREANRGLTGHGRGVGFVVRLGDGTRMTWIFGEGAT